ncbi:hypothetical protein Taro_051432 [Colocasia esculenta]|uniref:Uncharacterized protein n=1 Tax=Colocasia esculenta TaxID=4460 RepID=A0A843XG25_COLES|nr:hypothetical protein [Colocasia esculenta]
MLPPPCGDVCGLWAAPGWSIPWVCLSAGVTTVVYVSTLEEASARAGFALRTFWWGMRQVTSLRSVTEGDTFVAVSWQLCQEGRVTSQRFGMVLVVLAPPVHPVALLVVRQALVVAYVQSELLTGVSRVAATNYVLYRALLATEWVDGWLAPTAGSVGGCSRVVFGWCFLLFGPDLALARRRVSVTSWVSDAIVILVATNVCIAFLSHPAFSSRLIVASGQWVTTVFCCFGRLMPVRVAGEEEGRELCPDVVELAWSEEEVANPT